MRLPIRTLLLFSAIILSACSAIGEPPTLQFTTVDGAAAYDRGRSHFAAGRYGLAIKELRQAVNTNGGSVDALNALAAAYDQAGRFDLALHNYERALVIDPVSVQTLNNIGYSHYLQGRFDVAAVYLENAVALAADQPTVHGNVDLVEQALSTQPITYPAATQQLGAVQPEPELPASKMHIVRLSRQEQILTQSPVVPAALPTARDRGHPLLAGLTPASPMTIARPAQTPPASAAPQIAALAIAPTVSPLTIARPSSLTISPPLVSEVPVSQPELAAAGFLSDFVITDNAASVGSPAVPAIAKAFWISGQAVPMLGATTDTSRNSSYW